MHVGASFGIPASSPTTALTGVTILDQYEIYLGSNTTIVRGRPTTGPVRGAGLPSSRDSCVNHFFTHTNAGSTLGVGELASLDPYYLGGICSFMPYRNSNG